MSALSGKHILIVPAWWSSPEQPGAGVFFQDYARAFAAAGAQVGVIYPDLIPLHHWRRPGNKPILARTSIESCGDQVPVVRVRGVYSAMGRTTAQMRRFRSWLLKGLGVYRAAHGMPDLYHGFCTLPGGWAATHIQKEWQRPTVITEHTGPFADVVRQPAAARLAHAALDRANAVVAVSDVLADQMRAAGVQRDIDVCGNPVALEFISEPLPVVADRPRGKAKRPLALFVGRLSAAKGIHELMNVMRRLDEQFSKLELRLIGAVDADECYQHRGAATTTQIKIMGEKPRATVVRELQNADFFILPSHGETFGLAVAEALCMGVPVITTRGTACAAFINNSNGILCDPKDADSLYDALRSMIARLDEYDRRQIAIDARARFGSAAIVDWHAELYERVLKS